ncbi:mitochondrial inner membrane protease atp23 [Phtheirospermum japonicum]|uniref:Mitochondrial inner membrane protease ATP23 n=1 Tax=Phtheirospermum japonicum TaxID=374723 RepID=A0A830C413_9LAMI|nr:mitochondrial inner membrane protease atp23 [Phtheirospermum japonicum]
MTVDECQNMIQRSFRTPMVRFLREHLEKSGCGIGSNFIKAVHCKGATAGGYVKGQGIVVCSNRLQIQDEVTQVVIHELIHAYDECRAANLDWSDCAHLACSEVIYILNSNQTPFDLFYFFTFWFTVLIQIKLLPFFLFSLINLCIIT